MISEALIKKDPLLEKRSSILPNGDARFCLLENLMIYATVFFKMLPKLFFVYHVLINDQYTNHSLKFPNFLDCGFRSIELVNISHIELRTHLEIYVSCNGHPIA